MDKSAGKRATEAPEVSEATRSCCQVLEDLFRMLPPLKSSNFVDLKEELEAPTAPCGSAMACFIHHKKSNSWSHEKSYEYF